MEKVNGIGREKTDKQERIAWNCCGQSAATTYMTEFSSLDKATKAHFLRRFLISETSVVELESRPAGGVSMKNFLSKNSNHPTSVGVILAVFSRLGRQRQNNRPATDREPKLSSFFFC